MYNLPVGACLTFKWIQTGFRTPYRIIYKEQIFQSMYSDTLGMTGTQTMFMLNRTTYRRAFDVYLRTTFDYFVNKE